MDKPHRPPGHSFAALNVRGEAPIAQCAIFAGGAELSTAEARADLLAKVRSGEFSGPLDVRITSYVQRVTPNRNFVRFGRGTLRKGAHSFKGQVALVDHAQREQAARIGTITESKAVKNDTGEIAFQQTLSVVKRHAIESVLDGTIDRWSIGWYPTGPIDCSACKGPMFGKASTCPHWPGDALEGGGNVEAIYTAWEGVEVSAVNVPAVLGTGVDEIRAALAAEREGLSNTAPPAPGSKVMDIEALRKAFNLPASATEADILAHAAALGTRAADAERLALDAQIEAAYTDGRLGIARDPAGARVASSLETQIRALPLANASAMLAALPRQHPNGPALAQGGTPPPPPAPERNDAPPNPHLQPMLEQVGLSMKDVEAYGPQHRRGRTNGIAPPNLARLFRTRFRGDPGAHPGEK